LKTTKTELKKQQMKYRILMILVLSFISNKIISQTNEIINPKGKWFFGAEIGTNEITSFSNGESNNSFQGGILAEFYFARHWSLSGRFKYYNTGVSFYQPNTHTGGWIDLGTDESYGNFKGAVLSIPLDIKWEFRINKNLGGSLKVGYAHNIETSSNYGKYSANANTNFPKQYGSSNAGYGLNYFLKKNIAVYLDVEFYSGAAKGYSNGFFGKTSYNTLNHLTNFGIKYNFKKDK
jgi:hypothetical protein